jgi:hypothetical protein
MKGGVWSKTRRNVIANRWRDCERLTDKHEKTKCRVDQKRSIAQAYWKDPYDIYDDNQQIRTIKQLLENKYDDDIEELVDELEKRESFQKSRKSLIKSRRQRKLTNNINRANSLFEFESDSTDDRKSSDPQVEPVTSKHNPDFLRDWYATQKPLRESRNKREAANASRRESRNKSIDDQRKKEHLTRKRKRE